MIYEEHDETRNEQIHSFAVKYRQLFAKTDVRERELQEGFAEKCRALNFEMDSGTAFIEKHSKEAFYDSENLMRIVKEIRDIDILGSGIFSKWRYVTHWTSEDLTSEENRAWFHAALTRLSELTEHGM